MLLSHCIAFSILTSDRVFIIKWGKEEKEEMEKWMAEAGFYCIFKTVKWIIAGYLRDQTYGCNKKAIKGREVYIC